MHFMHIIRSTENGNITKIQPFEITHICVRIRHDIGTVTISYRPSGLGLERRIKDDVIIQNDFPYDHVNLFVMYAFWLLCYALTLLGNNYFQGAHGLWKSGKTGKISQQKSLQGKNQGILKFG